MLEVALFGKPNSGKSSFFKAATMLDVLISSRPFTTIKPNRGIGYVVVDCVCKEFNVKCNPKVGKCEKGKRYIPIQLWDVAGLVRDAHLGKGMGTAFLDDIRRASALIHIVDFSGLTDEEGKPTVGHDPAKDIEFLEKEIDLWFAEIIKRAVSKIGKIVGRSQSDLIQLLTEQLSGLEISKENIQKVLETCSLADINRFATELRKISKPILIAANKIDLKEAQENFERLKGRYEHIVPTSAEAEIALKKAAEKGLIDYVPGDGFEVKGELEEKQKAALEFIKKNVIEKYGSTGVQDCLNKAVFDLLGFIPVYPVEDENKLSDKFGNVLPDVFLMPKGSTALDLAFKVHTEIGEKFICAIDARTKKRLGKDYKLQKNDVIKIVSGR
jgi:ribosome-binding ATPase YchF (GTP1/OBG family)